MSAAEALASERGPLIRVAEFQPLRTVLIQTRLAGTKESVLDKTVGVTRDRLAALGGELVDEMRADHTEGAVANAIASARGSAPTCC